jgi:hypothetical protein
VPLLKRIDLVVMVVMVIGIVGYGLASILYTGLQVAQADRTLAAVVGHQNSLNTTFVDIDSQVSTLDTTKPFDSEQALTLVDLSIENSNVATRTIDEDDRSLSEAAKALYAAPWLTPTEHGDLDRESARLAHARAALAAARVIATDESLDGQFWHALYAALADFSTFETSNDVLAYRSAKAEFAFATEMAAYAPGLPDDLHALMTDLEAFMADTDLGTSVAGDLNRIAAYNIDTIGSEIDAFYRPMIDRYNSEISAATAG